MVVQDRYKKTVSADGKSILSDFTKELIVIISYSSHNIGKSICVNSCSCMKSHWLQRKSEKIGLEWPQEVTESIPCPKPEVTTP